MNNLEMIIVENKLTPTKFSPTNKENICFSLKEVRKGIKLRKCYKGKKKKNQASTRLSIIY